MPELPEVETIRRALAPALAGRRIVDGWGHSSAKFSAAPAATGARLGDVGRRGKYLITPLDADRELVVHLGMTGRLSFDAADSDVGAHTRAWWVLDDGRRLRFDDVRRFGRLGVVPAGDHRSMPTLAALGPEPLGDGFTPDGLRAAVNRSRVRIKTQLLRQHVVAGVGNIYADEALWLAGVHPGRGRLTRAGATAVHAAIRAVLTDAIAHRGTTLRDYRSVDGSAGANQHRLSCYGRGGEPCLRCARPLRSQVLDARTTTWCVTCQPSR